MDRYNTSHCLDITAALAISKADRDIKKSKTTKKGLLEKFTCLTYRIGEMFAVKYVDGKILIHRRGTEDCAIHKM